MNLFEIFVCDSDVFLRVDIFTHQPPLLRCYLISTFLNWCLIQLFKRDESIIINIDVVKIIDQLLIRRFASAGLSLLCVVRWVSRASFFFLSSNISFQQLQNMFVLVKRLKPSTQKREKHFLHRRTILFSIQKMYRSKKVSFSEPHLFFFFSYKNWTFVNFFRKSYRKSIFLFMIKRMFRSLSKELRKLKKDSLLLVFRYFQQDSSCLEKPCFAMISIVDPRISVSKVQRKYLFFSDSDWDRKRETGERERERKRERFSSESVHIIVSDS